MTNKARGLGKGLGALMGNVPSADQLRKPVGYINKEVASPAVPAQDAGILRIPMDEVEANPFQPRMSFDSAALEELAASIRSLGLIQPVTVRRSGGRYQIISGERRFRACRLAGLTMIPAYVREADDQGMLEMAIVENIQRENLDPVELALSYRRLMDECSLTQEQMADRVGKKRATVANTLRILKLPVKVQHDLKVGLINSGHAKALLGVEDPELQERLCDITVSRDLSVRELEALVRKTRKESSAASGPVPEELPEQYGRLLTCMGRYFSKDISLRRSQSGKGTMTIHFSSDREVERFLGALEDYSGR